MSTRGPRHWFWLLVRIAAAVALIGTASLPFAAPTIAAAACPSCYGMQPIGENVFVDAAMSDNAKRNLQNTISAAEIPIATFFGSVSSRRVILACGNEDCETRLKSRLEGAARVRAFAYDAGGYAVIRFSPRGLSRVIIAHELTHVEVHERIGFLNHMRGAFPAWFDEGLAVLLSDDPRYLRPGRTAAERCQPTPDGELPSTPLAWDEMAGKSEWIYAKAACEVMRWMDANGGKEGVLSSLAKVAVGERFIPE
jgi:hypothetical protein